MVGKSASNLPILGLRRMPRMRAPNFCTERENGEVCKSSCKSSMFFRISQPALTFARTPHLRGVYVQGFTIWPPILTLSGQKDRRKNTCETFVEPIHSRKAAIQCEDFPVRKLAEAATGTARLGDAMDKVPKSLLQGSVQVAENVSPPNTVSAIRKPFDFGTPEASA